MSGVRASSVRSAPSVAVARRRFGVDGAVALIDTLLPALEVLSVPPAIHAAALARYRGSLPTGTSFVDHVSFELVPREGIEAAFVFDADVDAAGGSGHSVTQPSLSPGQWPCFGPR